MQNLSEQQHDMEPEEERPKDIDFVMPMEFDVNEPLGNLYKEILANPVTRTMDYGKDCILPGTKITREECQRGKLLTFLYEKHKRENPDQWERGIPGNDLKAFMQFPVECRTCLLYRYAPGSPENVKEGGKTPHEIKERRIWGGMGGLMAMLFTTGFGQNLAGLSFLTSAIIGTFLGAAVFYIAQGRAPQALADHAHGPREADSSPRGVLRPRGTEVPTGHGGTRYREVDVEHPFDAQAAPPAGAIIEGKAEPTPHIQAAAPPTITGGNTAQTPEPARATPAPAMRGPGQVEMDAVVPAKYAEPNPRPKEVLPVKVETKAPAEPPAPKNPAPARTPKQPSKKVPAKGKAPAKKAEAKVEEKKQEPKKEPAPVKEPPAPAAKGFSCDHPGCGKVCQTKAALTSHMITHRKAGASP